MTVGTKNLLHLIDLFSGLDAEATNAIGEKCRWLRIPADSIVLDQSDNSDEVYFVTEGKLAVTFFSAKGREVGYTQLGRGDVFGEFAAIDGNSRSASVVTLKESVVAAMKASNFVDLIYRHPSVALQLTKLLVAKNRALTQRILEFSTLSAPSRVAAELLRLVSTNDVNGSTLAVIDMPTHYQIAARISSNREAVSRAISSLTKKGIVEHKAHTLTVLDMQQLRIAAGAEEI